MNESVKHIERCVDVIINDKNISEETIKIMFLVYKDLVIKEYIKEKSKK
jgi:hypothetical protein